MPPWHARLHVGSPSSKPSSAPEPSATKGPAKESKQYSELREEAQLLGVPLYSAQTPRSSKTTPHSLHSRSFSHPFPSILSSNKHPGESCEPSNGDILMDGSDGPSSFPQGTGPRDLFTPRGQHTSARSTDKVLVSGRCATCDSLVRWPEGLGVFRCTVCLMINDLRPNLQYPEASARGSPKTGIIIRPTTDAQNVVRVPSISLDQTRQIIDESLNNFVNSQSKASAENSLLASHSKVKAIQSSSLAKQSPAKGYRPSKDGFPFEDSQDSGSQQRIFQDLETYIIACFSGIECLNSSFLTSRPAPPIRAASESAIVEHCTVSSGDDWLEGESHFPELDAKTLLLGDFAENGTWWAGRSPPMNILRPQSGEGRTEPRSERVNSKSPCINWADVGEWFNTISSLQQTSITRLQHAHAPLAAASTSSRNFELHQIQQKMYEGIASSCAHVHRTLLKATESLLRRPGQPLRNPADCRFLLIVLANPLLTLSDNVSPARTSPSAPKALPLQSPGHLTRFTPSSIERSPKSKALMNGSASIHSSILKRILGLMSNLPLGCRQYLVNWFSRFSETHLKSIVELTGSFVSHRLLRLQGRKRSNSHDPTAGGLIPNMSGPGAGTSAHLHAAIGVSQGPKPHEGSAPGTPYGDDWQVKAAAKVMLLLFTANNNDQLRWYDGLNAASYDSRRARASSAARRRAHRKGQLLPTNTFYNAMLDYYDLVADFENWESRRGKFCFCQYPMFLSLWAKIRIMEYDARRQMEIKAMEAFFNSIISRKAVSQYLVLKVRRDCLVEDSLRNISEVVGTGQGEIKKGLRIEFLGEEGLDSGGLRKEWFLLLVREIFDPDHGLFVYDEESHYCYFNPHSFETSDQFFLVGVLLGLAIYNSTILDVALPPFTFRKLLASAPSYFGPITHSSRPTQGCTLDDLAEYRPSLARGLSKLLEYDDDVEETFLLDFVAVTERFGQVQHMPLCTNGEHRPVTNENRREYVDLYVRYLLDTAVYRQYEPFKRGFFTVCGGNALSLFRPEEIELLVRGSEESLDVATLKAVAVYDGWGALGKPANEPTVAWFWEAFSKAEPRDQRKLLGFITASDRIPAMGARSLVIKIVCLGDDVQRYPIARTCFNMIGLHRYPSKATLESKLWRAVVEGEGFGMK